MQPFDFAAHAATLRANGKSIAQHVRHCPNVVWFDLVWFYALRFTPSVNNQFNSEHRIAIGYAKRILSS